MHGSHIEVCTRRGEHHVVAWNSENCSMSWMVRYFPFLASPVGAISNTEEKVQSYSTIVSVSRCTRRNASHHAVDRQNTQIHTYIRPPIKIRRRPVVLRILGMGCCLRIPCTPPFPSRFSKAGIDVIVGHDVLGIKQLSQCIEVIDRESECTLSQTPRTYEGTGANLCEW